MTVAQAAIGSISFISATPTNIALKGTGDASRPESSTVVFKVLDASGGPRSGTPVSFVLNSNVGGITLTPASATATSDTQGLVQIVVNAGTVATSVKVTASINPAGRTRGHFDPVQPVDHYDRHTDRQQLLLGGGLSQRRRLVS